MQADPPTSPADDAAPQDETPQARPVPDEPGPRDVPDSQVIDKTLPATKPGDADRPA